MNFIFYLKLYALTVPVFFVVDIVWLGFAAKKFYRNNLGFILSPDVNWSAAISFYLLYIVGQQCKKILNLNNTTAGIVAFFIITFFLNLFLALVNISSAKIETLLLWSTIAVLIFLRIWKSSAGSTVLA